MKKLKTIPSMDCKEGCGSCCGYAPATTTEFNRIMRYVRANGIVPVDQGMTCPFHQGGKCAVYEVRPLSCKLFGHVEGITCPHGLNVNMDQRQVVRMVRSNGLCTRLVHHALEEMGIAKVVIPKPIEALLQRAREGGPR